ncbi:MAG: Hpt domain-containing protein [Chloroflexi bacterium]|nr:Hpt domain-containing protein [Chloroflexota bacterium]
MDSQTASSYGVNNNGALATNQALSLDGNLRPGAGLATLTDSALFDLSEMISDRDPLILTELVEAFLSEATRQVNNMARGIRENDLSLLFLAAHNLKSSSATFGAMRLARLSQMLEDLLSGSRHIDVLGHFVTEIEAESTLVFVAMRNALAQWQA